MTLERAHIVRSGSCRATGLCAGAAQGDFPREDPSLRAPVCRPWLRGAGGPPLVYVHAAGHGEIETCTFFLPGIACSGHTTGTHAS